MTSIDKNAGGSMEVVRVSGTPREYKYARARARGWNDVRRDRGFRPEYDKWKRLLQFAYERGRFQATLAKTSRWPSNEPLPVWNRDQVFMQVLIAAVGVPQAHVIEQATREVRRRKAK